MRCAVFNCSNSKYRNPNLSFFAFPKDEKIRKQWAQFCRLDEKNMKTSHSVCSEHFKPDDIKGDMKLKMGFGVRRFLKPDTVPSIHVNSTPSDQNRADRLEKRNNQKIVETLLAEYSSFCPNKVSTEDIGNSEGYVKGDNQLQVETLLDGQEMHYDEIIISDRNCAQKLQKRNIKQIKATTLPEEYISFCPNKVSTEKIDASEEYVKVENEVKVKTVINCSKSQEMHSDGIKTENTSLVQDATIEKDSLKRPVKYQTKTNKALKRELFNLRKSLLITKKKFAYERKILEKKLFKAQQEKTKLEEKLQEVQIRKVDNGSSIGQNSMVFLLCPAIKTTQRLNQVNIKPEILHPSENVDVNEQN